MIVRLHDVKKLSSEDYRFRLDLLDPMRSSWEAGTAASKSISHDGADGAHHATTPRMLKATYDTYAMRPTSRPAPSRAASCGTWAARSTTTSTTSSPRGVLGAFQVGANDAVGAPQILP